MKIPGHINTVGIGNNKAYHKQSWENFNPALKL